MLSQLHIQKSDTEWEVIHGNMQSTVWDDFTLDRQGDLTEWLYTHHRDEYTENWNRLAKEYSPIVKKYVTELANTQTINDDLASYLEWDLIHLLIEGYFQKLENAPLFYLPNILSEYQTNRVPCAWEGSYPNGELVCV
jgi:hypothetical protein